MFHLASIGLLYTTFSSERQVVVSTLWHGPFLDLEHFKRVQNSLSSLTRLNNVVNVATLGCLERVSEGALLLRSLFFNVLAAENDFDSTPGAYYGNLCRRLGVVKVALQVLRGHHIVCTTVGFAGDDR